MRTARQNLGLLHQIENETARRHHGFKDPHSGAKIIFLAACGRSEPMPNGRGKRSKRPR
jgi:hypothetical protein